MPACLRACAEIRASGEGEGFFSRTVADPGAGQPGARIEHLGLGALGEGQGAGAVGGGRGARQDLGEGLVRREARVGAAEGDAVARAARADVGVHADELGARGPLAQRDGLGVGRRGPGLVAHVRVAVCGNGLVPDLVEFLDPGVQLVVGGVVRGPQRLAVVGVAGAAEVLLLALVDDGDAVHQDGEGDGVLGERDVRGQRREARVVVVLDEGS